MSRNRSPLADYNREVLRPGPRRGMRVVLSGGSAGGGATYLISIVSGNTLYAATAYWPLIRGIKYVGSIPTSVPAASPTVGATYADGLGCGYLLNPDGTNGPLVWVANCPNTTSGGAVAPMALPATEEAQATCLVTVTRPVTGGGTATVYLIWAV